VLAEIVAAWATGSTTVFADPLNTATAMPATSTAPTAAATSFTRAPREAGAGGGSIVTGSGVPGGGTEVLTAISSAACGDT
jgi:hypothetical protein